MAGRFWNPRYWLVMTTLALLALTAWSLRYFGQYQPFAELHQEYAQSGDIGLAATDAIVVGHAGAHRRWRASVQKITFSRDRRSVEIENLAQVLLLDNRERPLVAVSAGHAQYQTLFGLSSPAFGSLLRMDGGIHATVLRAQGPVFSTQSLIWNAAANQITCPQRLSAMLPHLSVNAGSAVYTLGSGLTALHAQEELRLGNGITATIRSARGMAQVSTNGLTWDPKQNMALSIGPVSALLPGSVGPATADAIIVDTRSGDIRARHLHGTFRVSGMVQ